MSEGWIAGVVVAGLIGAVVTKPSQADFEAQIGSAFQQQRNSTWNDGNILGWGATALADNLRSGQYTDNIVMSKYILTIGNDVVAECTGIFGTINCGNSGG